MAAIPTDCDLELDEQRVRLEAERVQAKLESFVDTSSEVILRFDFMSNHDTRVRCCMWSASSWHIVLGTYWFLQAAFGCCTGCYACGVCCNLCWLCHFPGSIHQHLHHGKPSPCQWVGGDTPASSALTFDNCAPLLRQVS